MPAAAAAAVVYREDGKPENVTEELQQQLASASTTKSPTDTKLSEQQLQEVSVEGGGAQPDCTCAIAACDSCSIRRWSCDATELCVSATTSVKEHVGIVNIGIC
jgi:hypothetical protein